MGISLQVFYVFACAEHFGAGFVLRVVVEVAHDHYADLGIYAPERVCYCLAEGCSRFSVGRGLFLSADSRGPVVDDHGHALAEKRAYDAHLVASAERYGCQAVVGYVLQTEVAGIVEQAYVDAAGVGGVVVHYFQVPFGYFGLCHEVVEHRAVLDFRYTDDGGPVWRGACGEVRYCVGEIM